MGNKSKKLYAGVAAVLLLVAGGTGWTISQLGDAAKNKPAAAESRTDTTPAKQGVRPVAYDGQAGKNALELLEQEVTIVTKDSSYGPYVDTINGTPGGTDGKYWAFYVNGQLSQVGAADYVTKAGDSIEWKFE